MFCLLFLTVPHGFHIPHYISHLYQLPSLEDECATQPPHVRVTFSVHSPLVPQLVVSAYAPIPGAWWDVTNLTWLSAFSFSNGLSPFLTPSHIFFFFAKFYLSPLHPLCFNNNDFTFCFRDKLSLISIKQNLLFLSYPGSWRVLCSAIQRWKKKCFVFL